MSMQLWRIAVESPTYAASELELVLFQILAIMASDNR